MENDFFFFFAARLTFASPALTRSPARSNVAAAAPPPPPPVSGHTPRLPAAGERDPARPWAGKEPGGVGVAKTPPSAGSSGQEQQWSLGKSERDVRGCRPAEV